MKNKSKILKEKINERRALIVPGCHDALSAKIIEKAGFEAVQISGFGLAGSWLGAPDVGLLQINDILAATWNIIQAVEVPVMADIDTGGGNVVNAVQVVNRLIDMGAAGFNIEDQVFPKRCGHMEGKEVIAATEMIGKIEALAELKQERDPDLVINARTDSYLPRGLDEAINRCNLYLEAGADLVFIDGIKTRADIERAVKEIQGPLSINLMDAVTGVKTELIPVPELAAMGVARVSIPVASILVAHRACMEFFQALKASPTGLLAGQTDRLTAFSDYAEFVGLREYNELEKKYLPREKFQKKYNQT
ncbi:MAG TPA: isocitrate lyase/PEP mutase family protein [Desulfobulbaceae bacterium]|nr:isocitrate lyase/PEP mutase family protein [Desulfobulbaceae bacterium]